MRDVHCSRAGRLTSRCGLRNASKWLPPRDSRVLAGAASDDMGATIHFRLRLVEVPRIEGREHKVTVAVGHCTAAVHPFLPSRLNAHGETPRLHLVEDRIAFRVFGGPDQLQCLGLADAGNVDASQGAKHVVRRVARGPLLCYRGSKANSPGARAMSAAEKSAVLINLLAISVSSLHDTFFWSSYFYQPPCIWSA